MPDLIQCETCSHDVYEDATHCPNCNAPVRPEWVAEQKDLAEEQWRREMDGRPPVQAMYGPPPFALRQIRRSYAVLIAIAAIAAALVFYFMFMR